MRSWLILDEWSEDLMRAYYMLASEGCNLYFPSETTLARAVSRYNGFSHHENDQSLMICFRHSVCHNLIWTCKCTVSSSPMTLKQTDSQTFCVGPWHRWFSMMPSSTWGLAREVATENKKKNILCSLSIILREVILGYHPNN